MVVCFRWCGTIVLCGKIRKVKYETTRKDSCGSRVNSRMMFSRQIGDQSYTSSHVDYYPFGLEQSTTADSRAALVQYGFPAWMYSGNELDQLNGLNQYDFHARWLDNVVARFTTPDPLAESHYEESPYVYCGNDPVNQVDPLGLDWYYNQEGEFPKYIKGHEENKNYKYHDKTRMLESDHYKYFFGEYGSIYIVEKMTGNINGFLPEPQVTPTGTSLSYNVYSYESLNTMMGEGNRDGGHSATDWLGLTSSVADPIGGGADKILINRGAYMPRGGIYKANIPITVRTPIVNINTTSKVLNGVRVVGKVAVVTSVLATGYQVGKDIQNGKYYSAGTRVAVAGIAAGASFIPVVGWGVALGIGVADFVWGDEFYNYVETKFGN
mgnify:CR=1 FL=1